MCLHRFRVTRYAFSRHCRADSTLRGRSLYRLGLFITRTIRAAHGCQVTGVEGRRPLNSDRACDIIDARAPRNLFLLRRSCRGYAEARPRGEIARDCLRRALPPSDETYLAFEIKGSRGPSLSEAQMENKTSLAFELTAVDFTWTNCSRDLLAGMFDVES